jgi:hypothetical protein
MREHSEADMAENYREVTRAGILIVYNIGAVLTYVYLTIHDWGLASGWLWLGAQVLNVLRAALWPVYLPLSAFWFQGPLPPDRM